MPEIMINKELVLKLHWQQSYFLKKRKKYFSALMDQSNVPLSPIPPEFIMAAVLRLIRNMAF
jgi:hypothetical protein